MRGWHRCRRPARRAHAIDDHRLGGARLPGAGVEQRQLLTRDDEHGAVFGEGHVSRSLERERIPFRLLASGFQVAEGGGTRDQKRGRRTVGADGERRHVVEGHALDRRGLPAGDVDPAVVQDHRVVIGGEHQGIGVRSLRLGRLGRAQRYIQPDMSLRQFHGAEPLSAYRVQPASRWRHGHRRECLDLAKTGQTICILRLRHLPQRPKQVTLSLGIGHPACRLHGELQSGGHVPFRNRSHPCGHHQ